MKMTDATTPQDALNAALATPRGQALNTAYKLATGAQTAAWSDVVAAYVACQANALPGNEADQLGRITMVLSAAMGHIQTYLASFVASQPDPTTALTVPRGAALTSVIQLGSATAQVAYSALIATLQTAQSEKTLSSDEQQQISNLITVLNAGATSVKGLYAALIAGAITTAAA
jgi:hypothetical protein